MNKKVLIISVILALIIGVCSFVAVSAHTSPNVVSPTSSSQKPLTNTNNSMDYFYNKLKDNGIKLKKTDEIPKLNEKEAIEIAKKHIGERISNEAKSIIALYVKLTDRPGGKNSPALILPGTNIVMEDIPVWIVTFHGVNAPRYGPGPRFDSNGKRVVENVVPYVYGDLNVVIDANTGYVLEAFSYNIPKS